MTISATTIKESYSCNGSLTSFDFSFPLNSASDVIVIVRDSANVPTILTPTTQFEISTGELDYSNGGTITTVSYLSGSRVLYPWPSGYTLTIYRNTPETQPSVYLPNRTFNQQSLMRDLDRTIMIIQEVYARVLKSIKAPVDDTLNFQDLPMAADRANTYLAFDANGDVIVTTASLSGEVPVSTFMETILGIPNISTLISTLGLPGLATYNQFTNYQQLKGSQLILRFKDTTSGSEWGIGVASGNLIIYENTGTELYPVWTVRNTFMSGHGVCEIPVGGVIEWPIDSPIPARFLEENGASLSRTTYAALYGVLGLTYGYADGTHFYIRDRRGRGSRGWDHGAGRDPDAATRTNRGDGVTGDHVGTNQTDAFKSHTHPGIPTSAGAFAPDVSGGYVLYQQYNSSTGATGGNETRMININTMYIIRYI